MKRTARILTAAILTLGITLSGTVAAEAKPAAQDCLPSSTYLNHNQNTLSWKVPCKFYDSDLGKQLANDRANVAQAILNNASANQAYAKNIMLRDFLAITGSMSNISGIRGGLEEMGYSIINRYVTARYVQSFYSILQYHAQYVNDRHDYWNAMYKWFEVAQKVNGKVNKTWTKPMIKQYLQLIIDSKQVAYFVMDRTMFDALNYWWQRTDG